MGCLGVHSWSPILCLGMEMDGWFFWRTPSKNPSTFKACPSLDVKHLYLQEFVLVENRIKLHLAGVRWWGGLGGRESSLAFRNKISGNRHKIILIMARARPSHSCLLFGAFLAVTLLNPCGNFREKGLLAFLLLFLTNEEEFY